MSAHLAHRVDGLPAELVSELLELAEHDRAKGREPTHLLDVEPLQRRGKGDLVEERRRLGSCVACVTGEVQQGGGPVSSG